MTVYDRFRGLVQRRGKPVAAALVGIACISLGITLWWQFVSKRTPDGFLADLPMVTSLCVIAASVLNIARRTGP